MLLPFSHWFHCRNLKRTDFPKHHRLCNHQCRHKSTQTSPFSSASFSLITAYDVMFPVAEWRENEHCRLVMALLPSAPLEPAQTQRKHGQNRKLNLTLKSHPFLCFLLYIKGTQLCRLLRLLRFFQRNENSKRAVTQIKQIFGFTQNVKSTNGGH